VKKLAACIGAAAALLCTHAAHAEDHAYGDAEILRASEPSLALRVQSITTRITAYSQDGHGYQSQAGPLLGPGSERMTVLEPQLEIVAKQGDRITHRLWVPVDVITAASPDAIDRHADVVSGASRHDEAGTIDWTVTYRADGDTQLSMRNGAHLEETFRSWIGGLSASQGFAGDATVVTGSVLEVFDWFDRFDGEGHRHGRTSRSTTTGSVGVTQILTPTTVVAASYGLTFQTGELGNTWNTVPLLTWVRGAELLPLTRARQALVGRASQWLPWNGALRGYLRFYSDDWGILAGTAEAQWMQRISPALYVGALYRFHTQTGAYFFTPLGSPTDILRTADSDLAPMQTHTVGGKVVGDVPLAGSGPRVLHWEIGYERYLRSNDLQMHIATCSFGLTY
jgi:hypothetical protein